jgi:hypothetical protein
MSTGTKSVAGPPIADTLVFDTGESIVGVYSVRDRKYRAYYGDARVVAARRLQRAAAIVTYNGTRRDLPDLAALLGTPPSTASEILGVHHDMRAVCWSERIWGKSLHDTYLMHSATLPIFPGLDSYEADNRRDVMMTYRLWRHWRQGTLKILDGREH